MFYNLEKVIQDSGKNINKKGVTICILHIIKKVELNQIVCGGVFKTEIKIDNKIMKINFITKDFDYFVITIQDV